MTGKERIKLIYSWFKDYVPWKPKEIEKLFELMSYLGGLQDTESIHKIQLYFLYATNKQLKMYLK